jgi:tetratricopeptide (TPR) repeat protein
MKWVPSLAAAAAFIVILWSAPASADVDTDKLRAEFQGIVQGLNEDSFEKFRRAIVQKDMLARIFADRLIDTEVKRSFTSSYSTSLEQMFVSSFPKSKKEILGTVIDFQFQGNEGRAVVRYAASGYRYSYHVYELGRDSRGRLVIRDWIDYYQGGRFSDDAGVALVMAMPSRPASRKMLINKNLSDGDVFQIAELFKAVRDSKPARFFQIYDGLDQALLEEKVIVRASFALALIARDKARIRNAVRRLVETYPDDPLYSLRLVEYYISTRQYQEAIDALVVLQDGIGIKDGATESLKASAALAMGNTGDAEQFAVQATVVEPSLELGWWSLLRARTRDGNYSGATEALTRLEDDFGHTLDPETLQRDRFLKVLADKQEYLDWRASGE